MRQTGGSDQHPSRPFLCEWDGAPQSRLNRKLHPTLKVNSGTHFPHQHPLGKRIPFWTSITGCAFRFGVRGKLRPGIPAQTGMQFPDGAGFGKRVPL